MSAGSVKRRGVDSSLATAPRRRRVSSWLLGAVAAAIVGHASAAHARCRPNTCSSLNASCGTNIPDGCGGTIASCGALGGACGAGQVCTSGYACCTPNTSAQIGASCGSNLADGCGGTIASCGTCTAPQTCGSGGTASVPGSSAKTRAPLGDNCGSGPSYTCRGTLNRSPGTAPHTHD